MTKYEVSELVMKELKSTRVDAICNYLSIHTMLYEIPANSTLGNWMYDATNTINGLRAREKAVIDYVFNGADNFKVKMPAWVIISKHEYDEGGWLNLVLGNNDFIDYWHTQEWTLKKTAVKYATRITDPKLKDALLYANKDFEAIEVEI